MMASANSKDACEQRGDHRCGQTGLAKDEEAKRDAHEADICVAGIQPLDRRLPDPTLSLAGEKKCDRDRHDYSGGERRSKPRLGLN
jgi:hypothetical protein